VNGIHPDKESSRFLDWVCCHYSLYKKGFIYLASILPYDLLYPNQRKDGFWLSFWKPFCLFLFILTFINFLFLIAFLLY
jgi:hypothetical protein